MVTEAKLFRAVYFAAFQPQHGGGFTVTFPDVPAAITQGEDFESAMLSAIDVLETVLQDKLDLEETLPRKSERQEIASYNAAMNAEAVAIPVTLRAQS